jgi:hypothetical protein
LHIYIYNKFDIDLGCNKIRDDFDHMGSWVHWNGGQFEVDVGLFYLIDAVKGKEISIFLQIWTRKYENQSTAHKGYTCIYIYTINLTSI